MQVKQIKLKKCKCCKAEFKPFKSTEKVCSLHCSLSLAKVVTAQKETKRQAVEHKLLKVKITDWRKLLQSKLQEIARLIDYGQPCLATQREAKQYHGGHVFSRGSHSNMALNLHNIHRQGAQSNHFQSDDRLMHEGVKREYGLQYYENLSNLQGFQLPKFTNEDWHEKYKTACLISRELKAGQRVLNRDERIIERGHVNSMIGIYTN